MAKKLSYLHCIGVSFDADNGAKRIGMLLDAIVITL